MNRELEELKSTIRRWTLILGVLQITVGCAVRFISPSAVQWFRGIVMAHIEFTANGAAGLAAAFIGATSELMPTLNEMFPPPSGTESAIVSGALMLCGITIMMALLLTLYGLLRNRSTTP